MSDVTIIGLGEMGSALARAFVAADRDVTVWNRSPAKAAALEMQGARLARGAAEAISASPIVVVCVSDYEATSAILDGPGVQEALAGRIMVQLSSGIPKQARGLEKRVLAAGGTYLDGAIAAWPRQIGTDEAAILIGGSEEGFAGAEATLKLLAPGLSYVGPEIGAALALFNGALSYLAGHWIGFSYAAAICEAEGLPVGSFADMMAGLSPSLAEDLRHMGRVIEEGSYAKPESTLRTAGTDIARLIELSGDLQIGSAWPAFAASVFQKAIEEGLGDEEHCAISKVLRRP